MEKKWIAYGITGALGAAVLGGAAYAAANAMELRTGMGQVIAQGTITGAETDLAQRAVSVGSGALSAATPGEAPSAATPGSAATASTASTTTPGEQVASAASAPQPISEPVPAPAPPEPAPAPAPAQPVSPVSAASIASAPSVDDD